EWWLDSLTPGSRRGLRNCRRAAAGTRDFLPDTFRTSADCRIYFAWKIAMRSPRYDPTHNSLPICRVTVPAPNSGVLVSVSTSVTFRVFGSIFIIFEV